MTAILLFFYLFYMFSYRFIETAIEIPDKRPKYYIFGYMAAEREITAAISRSQTNNSINPIILF